MVRIELATLRTGHNELTLTPSAASLDVDPERFSDIRVMLELDAAADRIVVSYSTVADAHLVCDRTAEPFVQRVEGSHVVLFTTDAPSEDDTESRDTRAYSKTDRYLDLTEEVRDTLVLSLPARWIAPGAEEVELPTQFGVEEGDETDPRWDELKKLQN